MIVTIHQPEYLPYLGFFQKVAQADVLIIYDNTQFKKNNYQNRNRIRTKEGWIWLTVPVSYNFGDLINQVKIDNKQDWAKNHWKSIQANYSRAPYFSQYKSVFEDIYGRKWDKLADLNIALIKKALEIFDIKTKVVIASELGELKSKSTEALIELCLKVGAAEYISGKGGTEYLDSALFEKAGIKLIFQDFHHPEYKQSFSGFEPYMCFLDLLFNYGEKSLNIIKRDVKQ
jgi:hypothetical protein